MLAGFQKIDLIDVYLMKIMNFKLDTYVKLTKMQNNFARAGSGSTLAGLL